MKQKIESWIEGCYHHLMLVECLGFWVLGLGTVELGTWYQYCHFGTSLNTEPTTKPHLPAAKAQSQTVHFICFCHNASFRLPMLLGLGWDH